MPIPLPRWVSPPISLPDDFLERWLYEKNVLEMFPFSHTDLWTKYTSGIFPYPYTLGSRKVWKLSELLAYGNSLPQGGGKGPPQEVYDRMTAKAAERLSAATSSEPEEVETADAAAGDRFNRSIKPVTAARPLTRAERLALVGLK